MYSLLKNERWRVDTGCMHTLAAQLIRFHWSPCQLTMDGLFDSANLIAFEYYYTPEKLRALKDRLDGRRCIVGFSANDAIILITPCPICESESEYLTLLESRLKHPFNADANYRKWEYEPVKRILFVKSK